MTIRQQARAHARQARAYERALRSIDSAEPLRKSTDAFTAKDEARAIVADLARVHRIHAERLFAEAAQYGKPLPRCC